MMFKKASNSDKLLIYNLYNTIKDDDSSVIDYFFNEVFDINKYYILKESDVVKALICVFDDVIHFNNYNIEVNVIEEFLYADNVSKRDLDVFLEEAFAYFQTQKLMTLTKIKELSKYGFSDFSFANNLKIYRQDIFYVDNYQISSDCDISDLFNVYKQFSEHFDIYLHLNKNYFLNKHKWLKQLNYEIYVCKSDNEAIMGYIVYNYFEGKLQVSQLVYLDSVALMTLLNQAMGLNNYIDVTVSLAENLQKIFKNISYESVNDVYLRINDDELFKRLFKSDDNESGLDKYRKLRKYLRYY